MNEWLSTGQMIHKLDVWQKAEVVADGYVGGKVYMYESPITGYREIRWERTNTPLSIGGNMFKTKWKLLPKDERTLDDLKNEIQLVLDSPLTNFDELHEAIQDRLNSY